MSNDISVFFEHVREVKASFPLFMATVHGPFNARDITNFHLARMGLEPTDDAVEYFGHLVSALLYFENDFYGVFLKSKEGIGRMVWSEVEDYERSIAQMVKRMKADNESLNQYAKAKFGCRLDGPEAVN